MPEVWTTPVDAVPGEDYPSTDYNDQVVGNLLYLLNRPYAVQTVNEGADYTTTSATFVDVDATDLSKTVEVKSDHAFVHFDGVIYNNDINGGWALNVAVDGVDYFADDGALASSADDKVPVAFTRLITGLSAGNHTFKLRFKRYNAGTVTLYAGAGTAGNDGHPQFWVEA